MRFTGHEMEFHNYLKFRVRHWSGEKVLEPTRSEPRYARYFVSSLAMENDIRSSIRSLGVRRRCRSRMRDVSWPCCKSKKRPNPSMQTSRWLAAFILCDLLIGLLLPLWDLLIGWKLEVDFLKIADLYIKCTDFLHKYGRTGSSDNFVECLP